MVRFTAPGGQRAPILTRSLTSMVSFSVAGALVEAFIDLDAMAMTLQSQCSGTGCHMVDGRNRSCRKCGR